MNPNIVLAIATILVIAIGQLIFDRWVGEWLGLRPSRAVTARLEYADQLAFDGEVGRALLVIDELARRPHSKPDAARINLYAARFAFLLNQPDKAMACVQKSIGYFRGRHQRKNDPFTAQPLAEALQMVGEIYHRKRDFPAAAAAFEEVRQVSLAGAMLPTRVRTELNLAQLRSETGDESAAAEHARTAMTLAEQAELPFQVVEALLIEAVAISGLGDLPRCRALLDQAQARMPADATAALRARVLETRFELERVEENPRAEFDAAVGLLRAICDAKVGYGWRQHQAALVATVPDAERRALEIGSIDPDPDVVAQYVRVLAMLRQSEVALLLRGTGDVDDPVDDSELSAIIVDLLAGIAHAEGPTSSAKQARPLYEKLETATSARFRRLVQAPSLRERARVPHHLVQLRMITAQGRSTVYGSWEPAGADPEAYRVELPVDAVRAISEVTGLADRRQPNATAWTGTAQYRALVSGAGWSSLTSLLPPGLVALLSAVPANAADADIPLVLLSTDSTLWTFPWQALAIDATGTRLADRAAVALVPSGSLLGQTDPVRPASGVLSYLHGVNETGIGLERAALAQAWPGAVHEAADAAELLHSLTDADRYEVLAMTVHGDNRTGLAHSLVLDPATSTRLSAGRMMEMRFPRTVVVGACFSGNLDSRVGADPTGIPTVLLCRGASTVIGGLFPLSDGSASGHSTATILGDVYRELARGAKAPWALRRAQQRWRAGTDTSPVTWAGLTAMSNGTL